MAEIRKKEQKERKKKKKGPQYAVSLPVFGAGQTKPAYHLDLLAGGAFQQAVERLPDGQPLAGLRETMNRRWHSRWPRARGGLAPSCDRVRGAGWLVLRPCCANDLLAQAFSGRLDFKSFSYF